MSEKHAGSSRYMIGSRHRGTDPRSTGRRSLRNIGWPFAVLIAAIVSSPALAEEADCLDPAAIADADIAGHSEALSDPALCLFTTEIAENGIRWQLVTIANREMAGPLWAVPHDEEDAAFAGAVYAVRRYGGTVIAIENGEQRLVGNLDPNHVFAAERATATVCGLDDPWPRYVAAFLNDRDPAYPVIGLHTNWDGYLEAGGLGSISAFRDDEKMRPFPSAVAEGRFADEDTIAMLVGLAAPADSDDVRRAIESLNEDGVHVIYRHVTPDNNGCTLADYLTLGDLSFYINLEVEHGDAETMPALIDRAIDLLRFNRIPSSF